MINITGITNAKNPLPFQITIRILQLLNPSFKPYKKLVGEANGKKSEVNGRMPNSGEILDRFGRPETPTDMKSKQRGCP